MPQGRPSRAGSGIQARAHRKGKTSGSVRNRAQLDVPWNPLGETNGPAGGTGRPVPKRAKRP